MSMQRSIDSRIDPERSRAYAPDSSGIAAHVDTRPAAGTVHARAVKAQLRTNGAQVAANMQPQVAAMAALSGAQKSAVGFILTDLAFKPIYANDAALSILNFPGTSKPTPSTPGLARRIRTILGVDRFAAGVAPADFVSGKRLYVCRPLLLESHESRVRPPTVGLMLERCARDPLQLSEVSRQFHLSPRESETVQHISHGLTTKEVAQRMNVSPNTVKQFVRLIMSKMGVTTRSGIVGKLVAG